MMSDASDIRVCCAVIINGHKVFAAKRGPHSTHPLTWEFPGGKIEPGESEEACLHRELAEELNIKVQILRRLPSISHAYAGFSIILIPFVCKMLSDMPATNEHHETGWFSYDDLNRMNWSEADVGVFTHLSDLLN